MPEAVGKLWIELELQSGAFIKNMDAVEKQFANTTKAAERIGETIRNIGFAFSAFGAAIVGSAGVAVTAWGKVGDEIADMSKRTGLGVVALQELGYAAKLNGANLGDLEISVKKMQSAIIDADNGMAAAKLSLSELGLRVKDLIKLSPEQQFDKIAGAIAGIEDPTKRASLAVDLFGRSGTMLLPMLSEGQAGLRKMRDEASVFGNVMSKDAIKAADDFNDDLDRLKSAASAMGQELAMALIPTIRKLVDSAKETVVSIRAWIKDNSDLFNSISQITVTVGGLSLAVGTALLGVAGITKAITEMKAAVAVLSGALQGLWALMAAHPMVAVAAAIGLAVTAIAGLAVKAQDAANANINMGKTAKDLIALHEQEKKVILDKIAMLEKVKSMWSGNAARQLEAEKYIVEEKKKLALIEKAILSEKHKDAIEQEKARNAAVIAEDIQTNAVRMSLTQQFMANKGIARQADIDTEKLMQQELYASLGSSFALFVSENEQKTADWHSEILKLYAGFRGSLSAGFAATFKNIGDGWAALGKGMQAFGDMLINSIIGQISDLAAEWVMQHAVMAAATLLWGKKEIAVNAAVAGSKAAAESAFSLWGAVAIGAAVMAGVLALGDGFAHGGVVGGNSFTGDNVAAAVNSGEMILTRGQQANLFNMINSGGGSAGAQQTIIVQLDGRVIAQATAENMPSLLRLYGAAT